ncbi:MAG: hypothetical protein O7G87_09195 [bacterium]|nr:hypothetical protein [bacterium]
MPFPPFEALPVWLQVVLVLSSVFVLVIGGSVFWRMVQSVLGRGPKRPEP